MARHHLQEMRALLPAALVVFALFAAPASAVAQADSGTIDLMKPEPWLPPRYQSPRSGQQAPPPSPVLPPSPRRDMPPAIVVPETGRVLPNMRTLSPSGPNGTETGQDRAVRCADQLGRYGPQAGNPSGYLGTCVNQ